MFSSCYFVPIMNHFFLFFGWCAHCMVYLRRGVAMSHAACVSARPHTYKEQRSWHCIKLNPHALCCMTQGTMLCGWSCEVYWTSKWSSWLTILAAQQPAGWGPADFPWYG